MSDQPKVTCRMILDAMTLYRQNSSTAFERLERVEPDLACYVMEALTNINRKITSLGGEYRAQRQGYKLIRELTMVAVDAALRSREPEPEDTTSSDDAADA